MNARTIVSGLAMGLMLGSTAAGAAEMSLPSGMRVGMPVKSMKDLRFQATLRQQYDLSGDEALARIAEEWKGVEKSHRVPRSPETDEQAAFVRNYQPVPASSAA